MHAAEKKEHLHRKLKRLSGQMPMSCSNNLVVGWNRDTINQQLRTSVLLIMDNETKR